MAEEVHKQQLLSRISENHKLGMGNKKAELILECLVPVSLSLCFRDFYKQGWKRRYYFSVMSRQADCEKHLAQK